ncbi:hypothetical protein [Porphyrobacter sp. LM 6]|jgi:hypothetical protein|uniref:hypothetical protein n=1 Tax=Porphyrobacter sp. LM 6 TaxID=1896196 RepID=UPI0008475E23|nr:hypothetical protein [Porphyrobacter sp. LM 6]AOL95469.1 hypothetical protein BG023_112558 [Porphyrobacter sp. LM 6]
MTRYIVITLLLFSLSACSKTTTYEISNDSGKPIVAAEISQSGSPKVIGDLSPGEVRKVEFEAIFENSYRLKYEQDGKRFMKDLCYQAWGDKSYGKISVRPDGVDLICF